MPHVSRHTPVRKVSDKIFDTLLERVAVKGSVHERKSFFINLLTPTERIMLSKRFAVIYMLQKGYSFDAIQEVLRVSPSTIARLWTSIQKGKHIDVVKQMQVPQFERSFAEFFLDLMPPMNMSKKQYAERMRRLGL